MSNPFADDGDSAFLDVAANTLAIIIIVTVFALSVTRDAVPTSPEPDAVVDPPLAFRPGTREPFPPPSRFVVFVRDRAFSLDGDAIVARISARAPGPAVGEIVPQGRIDFMPVARSAYDIDVYQASFSPDPAYVDGLPALSGDAAVGFVDELDAAWRLDGHAPTFIVFPSGMDAFAAAHAGLEDREMPWRWTLVPEGEPVRIERTVRGFRSFTTYW